jgi:uncharacterized low-complexity protein
MESFRENYEKAKKKGSAEERMKFFKSAAMKFAEGAAKKAGEGVVTVLRAPSFEGQCGGWYAPPHRRESPLLTMQR